MNIISSELDPTRKVHQLHWGGGSPTFLSPEEMTGLWSEISSRFSFAADAEISIELDPRNTTDEHIEAIARCGFNRASLGIQDINPEVQQAVNRIQPFETTVRLIEKLRSKEIKGINFDLIYGLPKQTVAGFDETIEEVLQLRPDRISLFHFAYLPELKKHQKRIKKSDLPDVETRLEIFQKAVERFIESGYLYIGMDHFALPDDELAIAQKRKELHRNFQGYTTCRGCDLLGIGLTSIGEVADVYIQNEKDIKNYADKIEAGTLAIMKGFRLSADDKIRRHVIRELICHFDLQKRSIEEMYGINFNKYFKKELAELYEFENEGFLEMNSDSLKVTAPGRFVIRNICMVFDIYLKKLAAGGQKFSRTV